jgi:Uma2 family endonuclease
VYLRNVSWELYTQLRDDPERDHVYMTYFRGGLELMSPSGPHERMKRILEGLVTAWFEERELPYASFGSTTYRRKDRESGLEPDTCFYIEHETQVRDHENVDLERDPPPDLALEVDIRSSSQGRLPIYAQLGVPEVWRTNGEWLTFYQLDETREYREIPVSEALPGLTPELVLRFLQQRYELDELSLLRGFREAVRSGESS